VKLIHTRRGAGYTLDAAGSDGTSA
jgi:hypothetical protein